MDLNKLSKLELIEIIESLMTDEIYCNEKNDEYTREESIYNDAYMERHTDNDFYYNPFAEITANGRCL